MSCDCITPDDTPCSSPYFPDMGNPMIKMYLGERVSLDTGQLELFTASTEDFEIPYSAQQLIDAGILPPSVGGSFNLSERELLTTASYETWISYVSDMYHCGQPTFGSFVINAIGYDMTQWAQYVSDQIINLSSIGTQSDISNIGTFSHYFRFVTNDQVDVSVITSDADRHMMESKLILCYQWLRQIYDTFYGKQFLVKIGEQYNSELFSGVCIKNQFGQYPSSMGVPFVVDGDGTAQGLYVSDEVSTEGGMISNFAVPLLGLNLSNDSAIFRTDDGRLNCFVRFCSLTQNGGDIPIQKFGAEYLPDISKLSPENYIISRSFTNFAIYENLFLKANAANKLYVDTDGQWVLVTLSQLVPLIPLNGQGEYRYATDTVLRMFSDPFQDAFKSSIASVDSNKTEKDKSGSLNNSTVLNLFVPSEITIFPEAVAIPMKSNILRYGPYFAGTDDGGGVDIQYRDELAPWKFFDTPSSGIYQYNTESAYDTMNYIGQSLAQASIKDNLILEKGKITVAGIPEYNLGDQYQKIGVGIGDDGVRDSQALLTDISISYGASGFTTTYNFSTFSPRFGTPEKYILDRWSESIQGVQSVNRYLREERLNTRRLANTLKSSFAGRKIQAGFTDKQLGPKGKSSSTPNKLLLSGYYLSNELYLGNKDGDYTTIVDINKPDRICSPCASEPPLSEIPENNIEPSPNVYRQYTFAETHESYQDEYIQDTFYQLSIMSLDGMYLPVSLKGNPKPSGSDGCDPTDSDYRLPRFAMREENDGSFVDWFDNDQANNGLAGYPTYTKSRSSMPPFKYKSDDDSNNTYNLPITQQYINPILSESLLAYWDNRSGSSTSGFVISSIAFGCTFTDYQLTHSQKDEDTRQEQENFRFSALRGPLVLQAWGYDIHGKPIPNKFDIPKKAEAGKFKKHGLADVFMEDWLQNPKTWPVGPVDLRFDRERGVWTAASPNKIIVARLKERLEPYGKAVAELINPSSNGIHFYKNFDISGPNGENIKESISSGTIDVYDFLGINLCACDIVYAYYDDNRYIVLESSRKSSSAPCPPCSTPITPSPPISPSPSMMTPSPSPSACWCGLECLQGLQHYDPCKTQALIHKNGCLMWEDIVQCDPVQNAIEKEKELECRANLNHSFNVN